MNSANEKRKPRARRRAASLSEETRKRIFALAREWGLDDEARHDVQRSLIGKESLTDFTEADGRRLAEYLSGGLGADAAESRPRRRRRIRPDGIIEIHVVPTITRGQIRKAYALMYRVSELEGKLHERGALERPEERTDDLRARLDGWARKLSKNEARQLGELMKEEASNLIELLKDRTGWLMRKLDIEIQPRDSSDTEIE